jgi:hypothetical protein
MVKKKKYEPNNYFTTNSNPNQKKKLRKKIYNPKNYFIANQTPIHET